jgi:hypothetical protein
MGDNNCFSVGKTAGAWSHSLTSVQYHVKKKKNDTSSVPILSLAGTILVKNSSQQTILKELRSVVCYGM